jgi:hypothetical protein
VSNSAEALQMLKEMAAGVRAGKCVECKWFKSEKFYQRFSWFGLRKDVETGDSIRYASCAAHMQYARTARQYDCKGKDWEPK